jgi:sialidase-1
MFRLIFPLNPSAVFEHLNVSPDGSVNGGRPRKFPLGDGFATVAGRDMLLLSTHNVTGDADGLRGNINHR